MNVTMPVAILIEIGFPFLLAVYFTRRFKTRWSIIWVGAAAFVLSQVVHIPLLSLFTNLFANGTLPTPPPQYNLVFNGVFLGLMAGLCEETARAAAYWILGKRARTFSEGVTLGIGHGGAESVLLVGLNVLAMYVTMWIYKTNPGVLGSAATSALSAQAASYWSMSWDLPLAGAFERLCTMAVQISFSVIVLQAFTRRNAWFYVAAILWHAVIDCTAVILSGLHLGTWPLEGVVFIFALLSLGIIYFFYRQEKIHPVIPESLSENLESKGVN